MIGGVLKAEDSKSLNQDDDVIIFGEREKEREERGKKRRIHTPFPDHMKMNPYEYSPTARSFTRRSKLERCQLASNLTSPASSYFG